MLFPPQIVSNWTDSQRGLWVEKDFEPTTESCILSVVCSNAAYLNGFFPLKIWLCLSQIAYKSLGIGKMVK